MNVQPFNPNQGIFVQPQPINHLKLLLDEGRFVDFKNQTLPQISLDRQMQREGIERDEKAFSFPQRNYNPPFRTRRIEQRQQEIGALSKLYNFTRKEKIKEFILKNSCVLPLLKEAPSQIKSTFGENVKLALKISTEPDSFQSDELWILILTELPASEAFPLLESFDKNWWLDNLERGNSKLNIRLEYV